MKYAIYVDVDTSQLKEAVTDTQGEDCGLSNKDAIEREMSWVEQSGIFTPNAQQMPTEQDQELVDKCLERIKQDIEAGDLTAIDELLKFIPKKYLEGFLPEC